MGLTALDVTSPLDFTKHLDGSVLKDQSVLITGGASGIGAAIARSLAGAGAYITIVDINRELAGSVVANLRAAGYKAQAVQADVTSWEQQVQAFKSAIQTSPNESLDLVIPCAGLVGVPIQTAAFPPADSPDADPPAPPTNTFDINLKGTYYTAVLALHYFKKTASHGTPLKHCIFISSIAGYLDIPSFAAYIGSKFGVRGIWKTLRCSPDILGVEGVKLRTNLVAPTWTNTPLTKDFVPVLEGQGIKAIDVQDTADVVARLAMDETAHARAVLVLDNGKSLDLRDDAEGLDAGPEIARAYKEKAFGDWENIKNVVGG